jgi:hypothetical protein
MYQRRPYQFRYICYSCVTGQAVWFYQGQSRKAMLRAYQRVRRREIALERRWPRMVERRRTSILFLLNECMAEIPILGKLTKEQREAAKTLQYLADNQPKYYTEFYNHIRAERRRRDKKSSRWHSKKRHKTEAQEKLQNTNYDK